MVCVTDYLEKSGCVADDVGELEDVGSELLLHVTQEEDRIFGGEPADVCHCDRKVIQKCVDILENLLQKRLKKCKVKSTLNEFTIELHYLDLK